MKQTQSNPLRVELAKGEGTLPHPGEDVLTAFAENALSERERGRVMEHLAGCSECREVLSLAAAAAPETVIPQRVHVVPGVAVQRRWLPWLSAAAALVLVSSAVLIYVIRPRLSGHPESSPEIAVQSGGTDKHDVASAETPTIQSAETIPAIAASEPAAGSSNTSGRAHWRINEAGHAERLLGDGTWQAVLPDDSGRISVISVSGNDVWLGGEKLRICHSNDDGATWHCEHLRPKNGLASAITHIRFQSLQTGITEAADGTTWNTLDGGRTWK